METKDHYWRDGLHPFFEHLAPEGWLRGLQARAGGTADQDDFGILLNYGADCIGAVGVRHGDDHRRDDDEQDQHVNDPTRQTTEEPETVDEAAVVPGRTLSGVQKKLLAYQDSTGFHPAVSPNDPATHIAKFNREDLPSLVLNESSTLQLGREVLGSAEITKAERAQLRGLDGIALLVERFDRHGDVRLRLEDFAQILNRPRGRDFSGKYQSSYEEAAGAIAQHSVRSRIDLARYFALVVFNLVVGNADAHLKNFSLLERPEGLRLSPAYDLVNTIVYSQYERSTALEIGGRKRAFDEIDRPLLEAFGRDIGLPDRAVQKAIDGLAKGFASAPTLKPRDHVRPNEFRETYRETIINNAERMLV